MKNKRKELIYQNNYKIDLFTRNYDKNEGIIFVYQNGDYSYGIRYNVNNKKYVFTEYLIKINTKEYEESLRDYLIFLKTYGAYTSSTLEKIKEDDFVKFDFIEKEIILKDKHLLNSNEKEEVVKYFNNIKKYNFPIVKIKQVFEKRKNEQNQDIIQLVWKPIAMTKEEKEIERDILNKQVIQII